MKANVKFSKNLLAGFPGPPVTTVGRINRKDINHSFKIARAQQPSLHYQNHMDALKLRLVEQFAAASQTLRPKARCQIRKQTVGPRPSWIDFCRFSRPARPLERSPSSSSERPRRSTARYNVFIVSEILQRLADTGAALIDQIKYTGPPGGFAAPYRWKPSSTRTRRP